MLMPAISPRTYIRRSKRKNTARSYDHDAHRVDLRMVYFLSDCRCSMAV
jgi:hypothetical protein